MLMIRLQRVGARHQPVFRMVVTDKRTGPKSGKHIEVVGSVDHRRGDEKVQLKAERISYWLEQGVKPSDTVHNYLVDVGLIKSQKINVLPKKTPIVAEAEPGSATAETGEPSAAVEDTEAGEGQTAGSETEAVVEEGKAEEEKSDEADGSVSAEAESVSETDGTANNPESDSAETVTADESAKQ